MEDTHVWVMDGSGAKRREVGRIDNRQGAPEWSADGRLAVFHRAGAGQQPRLIASRLTGGEPRGRHAVKEAWAGGHRSATAGSSMPSRIARGPSQLFISDRREDQRHPVD